MIPINTSFPIQVRHLGSIHAAFNPIYKSSITISMILRRLKKRGNLYLIETGVYICKSFPTIM
jgi:hypothetical protein